MSRLFGILAALSILFIFAIPAFAQQSATDAGQIEKRIKTQEAAPTETKAVTPTLKRPEKLAEEKVKPFVLTAVNVDGATAYPVSAFAPLYEEFIGKEIGGKEIEQILERITAKYTGDGYFLSLATAPAQNLTLGILNIDITEGYIEKVTYTGAKPGRPDLFDSWAAKIERGRPARLSTVERYILLMNDMPGLTATPGIEPKKGDDTGAFEMTIALKQTRADGYSSLDNRGTHSVGPLEWSLSGGLNSPFGALGRTRVSTFTIPDAPRELLYGEVYQQIPVGSEGTQVFVSASRSLIDTFSQSRGSTLQAASDRYSAGFWNPLIRQRDVALYLNGRFDYSNSTQTALNDNYNDRLRVARVGTRLWFKDGIEGTNTLVFQYSRGLDILGASPKGHNVSRTNGDPKFNKFTVDVDRLQHITGDWWVELSGAGQYSKDTLLSGEEFGIGGSRFGRAYDPSEISDSRGVAGSVELRRRLPIDVEYLSNLWVYGFYDGGVVWRSGSERDSLTSTGIGLRIFPFAGARASAELDKPLTRTVYEQGNKAARIFFNLAISF